VRALDSAIWRSMPIAPMPMLAALRDSVLMRSTKRMPKWKFRVADDVVVKIQPHTRTRTKANREGLPWFECLAVVHDEATGAMLKEPPRDGWNVRFKLTIRNGDCLDPPRFPTTWNFKVDGIGFGGGLKTDACMSIRDRLIETLPTAFDKLRPEMMLQHACLFCGKRLTDPVSMARWIGPECAGTAAAITPFVVNLAA
jgi:hypothetical protein